MKVASSPEDIDAYPPDCKASYQNSVILDGASAPFSQSPLPPKEAQLAPLAKQSRWHLADS